MAGIAVDNLQLFYRTGYDEIAVEWQFNRWNINEVDSFQVRFLYTIKNSITGEECKYAESSTTVDVASGFNDGTSVTRWRATYSPPDDWYKVDVRVFPVSKTYDQDGKQMSYFTGETAWDVIYRSETRPEGPGNAPELVFGGVNSNGETKLLAQVSVPDDRVTQVEFEFHWLTTGGLPSASIFRTVRTNPYNGYGSCNINAPSGHGFVVRCRFLNSGIGDYGYTEWSDYSNTVYTVPNSPTNLTAKASTKTSVYLRWKNPDDALFSNSSAVSDFEIEYVEDVNDFNDSATGGTIVQTGSLNPYYTVTGLEEGNEYFFRVRSVNDNGYSGWSNIVSVVLGAKPNAPTTWSSSSTVIVGETLNLYWVHNSEDGSDARSSQLELTIGTSTQTIDIPNTEIDDDDDENQTLVYSVDTSVYTEGTQVRWRVRTSGITEEYGDWSVRRTVNIYAKPNVIVELRDVSGTNIDMITELPIRVIAATSPSTQTPIGYFVSVISNDTYETRTVSGEPLLVNSGDVIFEKYINTKSQLDFRLSAGDIFFNVGSTYTFEVVASMDSGLSATSSTTATVSWTVPDYFIDARMSFDPSNCSMYLIPYCREADESLVVGMEMTVYRHEYDGELTLIAESLDNTQFVGITDPHPTLNYARYRIVATDRTTGTLTFFDTQPYPVQEKSVVIQWDERWTTFNGNETALLADTAWQGSFIKLPYNIDIQEDVSSDVTLVNYIGRSHPVSYYGTAISSSSTWNVSVPMYDEDTLFALRKLSKWTGDVYVREPSGSGYWANVAVSFNRKHLETAMPVTIDVTRVSGGM